MIHARPLAIPARISARIPGLMLILSLGGCAAGTGVYPSLAPREVEKRGFAEPEPAPAAVATPDPALDTKLAALSAEVDQIGSDFAKAAATAERSAAAAKGRTAGSDAWITAQTDLAALDDLHARNSAVITRIEEMAIARAAALAPDYPALAAARAKAQAASDAEGATIARLQASLAPA